MRYVAAVVLLLAIVAFLYCSTLSGAEFKALTIRVCMVLGIIMLIVAPIAKAIGTIR